MFFFDAENLYGNIFQRGKTPSPNLDVDRFSYSCRFSYPFHMYHIFYFCARFLAEQKKNIFTYIDSNTGCVKKNGILIPTF